MPKITSKTRRSRATKDRSKGIWTRETIIKKIQEHCDQMSKRPHDTRGHSNVLLEGLRLLLMEDGGMLKKESSDNIQALPPANIVVVKNEKEREKVIIRDADLADSSADD